MEKGIAGAHAPFALDERGTFLLVMRTKAMRDAAFGRDSAPCSDTLPLLRNGYNAAAPKHSHASLGATTLAHLRTQCWGAEFDFLKSSAFAFVFLKRLSTYAEKHY